MFYWITVLEENAYWDFRALVINDDQTLSPKDALLFLRVIHGDHFSSQIWEKFQVNYRFNIMNTRHKREMLYLICSGSNFWDLECIYNQENFIALKWTNNNKQRFVAAYIQDYCLQDVFFWSWMPSEMGYSVLLDIISGQYNKLFLFTGFHSSSEFLKFQSTLKSSRYVVGFGWLCDCMPLLTRQATLYQEF